VKCNIHDTSLGEREYNANLPKTIPATRGIGVLNIQAYKQNLLPCIENPTRGVTPTTFAMPGIKKV